MQNDLNIKFGMYFRQLRLKASIKTLAELGRILATKGYIYEDSILSHWQKGRKIPHNRDVLLVLLDIFSERSYLSIGEVNCFLESANHGYLTKEENALLPKIVLYSPFYVPPNIPSFVARMQEIEDVKDLLKNNNSVYIYGLAGVGKTAMAIRLGHLLKDDYPDGILWFRLDTTTIEEIFNTIALIFNLNLSNTSNIEIKAGIIRSALTTKRILLILDNSENREELDLLVQDSKFSRTIITTQKRDIIPPSSCSIYLKPFLDQETIILFEKILGHDNIDKIKEDLLKIGKHIGNLPLPINIIAQQILLHGNNITFIREKLRENIHLKSLYYDNKTLYSAIDIAYDSLSNHAKKVFISLAIFSSKDFSIQAVAYVNKLPLSEIFDIFLTLMNRTLLEKSSDNRYRVHPMINIYINQHDVSSESYRRLILYFIAHIGKSGHGNLKYFSFMESEFENIIGIYESCYKLQLYKEIIRLWQDLSGFLWDTGRWDEVEKYGLLLVKACKKIDDVREEAECLISKISWVYFWRDEMAKAEQAILSAIRLGENINNVEIIAYGMQRLALIYQNQKKYKEAITALKYALNKFKKTDLHYKTAKTVIFMGNVYEEEKNFDKAIIKYKEALSFSKRVNEVTAQAIANYYLGETYFHKNEILIALKYTKAAFYLEKKCKRLPGIAYCLNLFGNIQKVQKNYKEAIENYNKAILLFKQLGMHTQSELIQKEIKKIADTN